MLLDIKPQEIHGHCQLFARASRCTSETSVVNHHILQMFGVGFTQVELFLLAKQQTFLQLALNSSGKIFLVRLMPFFSSAHGSYKSQSSMYSPAIHLEVQDTTVLGRGGTQHIFSSSVSLQLSSVSFTSCSPQNCSLLLISYVSRHLLQHLLNYRQQKCPQFPGLQKFQKIKYTVCTFCPSVLIFHSVITLPVTFQGVRGISQNVTVCVHVHSMCIVL